jgi:hypothetical protein
MVKNALFFLAALLVCAPASAVTRTWTGAVSANWSEPGNWSPPGVPTIADTLVIGGSRPAMVNDLPAGTAIGPVVVNGGGSLSGNALTLTGEVSAGSTSGSLTWNTDLKIGAPIRIWGVLATFNGAIDINSQTVTFDVSFTPFNGPIRGAGNVLFLWQSGPAVIAGGGDFSGQMGGWINLMSDLPAATIATGAAPPLNIHGTIAGHGTVGDMLIRNPDSIVDPSSIWKRFGDPVGINTFRTRSLILAGTYNVNLSHVAACDRIEATDSVVLGGRLTTVVLSREPYVIADGTQFRIIDNQGRRPVSGTFAGLPEGSSFDAGPLTLRITYQGGDGNDVVLTNLGSTKSWTGKCASGDTTALWSLPCNWSPAVAPVPGEALEFGGSVFGGSSFAINDFPAWTVIGGLRFGQDSFTVSGNPIILDGDVAARYRYAAIAFDVKLARPTRVTAEQMDFQRGLDINGQTMTVDANTWVAKLSGSGSISALRRIHFGPATFSGTVSGVAQLGGDAPQTTIIATDLMGSGSAAAITVQEGGTVNPGCCPTQTAGTLRAKQLTIRGQYSLDIMAQTYGRLVADDSVLLDGATLLVALHGNAPPPGTFFTIIDNRGGLPVTGSFASLPEGAIVRAGTTAFVISYRGGDGNDVVLLAASDTRTATITSLSLSAAGAGKLAANIAVRSASGVGTPGGGVALNADGVRVGTAELVAGAATLTFDAPVSGRSILTVQYGGDADFAASTASVAVEPSPPPRHRPARH